LLREFRVTTFAASYIRSSLWLYIEKALAETVAQIGVYGLRQFLVGIRFPVNNGYVYLMRGGGYSPAMAGAGIIPEGAALIASGIMFGISFRLWFKQQVVDRDATSTSSGTGGCSR
jgi:hypothetical protein